MKTMQKIAYPLILAGSLSLFPLAAVAQHMDHAPAATQEAGDFQKMQDLMTAARNAATPEERQQLMRQHMQALRDHMKSMMAMMMSEQGMMRDQAQDQNQGMMGDQPSDQTPGQGMMGDRSGMGMMMDPAHMQQMHAHMADMQKMMAQMLDQQQMMLDMMAPSAD